MSHGDDLSRHGARSRKGTQGLGHLETRPGLLATVAFDYIARLCLRGPASEYWVVQKLGDPDPECLLVRDPRTTARTVERAHRRAGRRPWAQEADIGDDFLVGSGRGWRRQHFPELSGRTYQAA